MEKRPLPMVMGGFGSGRYPYSMQTTVSECRSIDVHDLHGEDYLEPGHGGTSSWSRDGEEIATIGWRITGDEDHPRLRLTYSVTTRTGEEHQVNYAVPIVHTECNFGGERPWFQCPGRRREDCGERVGKLYKPPGQLRFLCRHCYDLTYESNIRQGNFHYENVSKPVERHQEALEQLEQKGMNRETLREVYEAKKAIREGIVASAKRWPPTSIDVEPYPPFEEWLDDLLEEQLGELYGRPYGCYGRCEATAKTTGERCSQPATGGHGKCYYHGGASGPGAPKDNQNAVTDPAD